MTELNLELIMSKAEITKNELGTQDRLHNKETYHNHKGWKVAEETRKVYLHALANALKEMEDAIKSGNGYKINDAEITLRTTYNLAEKVLELHGK